MISSQAVKSDAKPPATTIEYSSREVSPPALLLQQLLRAHAVFLLHHGNTLSDLYVRLSRSKFCGLLDRFWNRFVLNWDVLLHGNPAVDMYNGIKLAAGGELGVGVGEEEWGSGEREVLEDFAGRTDGLVDIVVSRFGEPSKAQTQETGNTSTKKAKANPNTEELAEPWMGAGRQAEAADGVVFSGVGVLTRSSIRDISAWTEWIYTYGDFAYGVKDNPSSDRRKRKRKPPTSRKPEDASTSNGGPNLKTETSGVSRHDQLSPGLPAPTQSAEQPPGIPAPIVSAVERSLEQATTAADSRKQAEAKRSEDEPATPGATEKWMKYLTLGYGSTWGPTGSSRAEETRKDANQPDQSPDVKPEAIRQKSPEWQPMRHIEPEPDVDDFKERLKAQIEAEDKGHFIIGLKGSQDEELDEDDDEDTSEDRILLRTLHVSLVPRLQRPTAIRTTSYDASPSEADPDPATTPPDSAAAAHTLQSTATAPHRTRLRVVVYVHRPFIYTFVFAPQTASLSYTPFYRALHAFFAPLHRPLSTSTSAARVAARIAAYTASSADPTNPTRPAAQSPPATAVDPPIFDLVFDRRSAAVHASLPNIPAPGSAAAEGLVAEGHARGAWTRAEAMGVHGAVMEMVRGAAAAERRGGAVETSVKTGRGWWVVWMRVGVAEHGDPLDEARSDRAVHLQSVGSDDGEADWKEAVLVRKARDAAAMARPSGKRATSGFFGFGSLGAASGKDVSSGWGPARLAEGVGVDAKRYVEGLLSLNR